MARNTTTDSPNHPFLPAWEQADDHLARTFSALADVMEIAMWELDLEYRVIACNRKARQIYGDEAIGRFCYEVAAKIDRVCDDCPAQKVYEGATGGRSQRERTRANGEKIYIDHIATPIKDREGHVTGTLVLIIDITSQKLQEKELIAHRNNLEKLVTARTKDLEESQIRISRLLEESRKSRALYESLLNSSADAIAIYDLAGKVRYLSPSFTELFGWHTEEVQGRRIPFVPDSEKEASQREIRRLLETGEPTRNFATRRETRDGRLLDIRISASRYDDNSGQPAGILVILRDVTRAREMEQQLNRAQKMEALGTLAGGIAHDFNNLLMGIQGNISLLLLDADQRDERTDHLKNIKKYVKRGGNLTRQLLGLARAGKYEIHTLDINALVAGSAAMFGQTRREIAIHCDLADDAGTTEADAGQVEQVLLNLFVNASQAMPDGGDLYLATTRICLDHVAAGAHGCASGDYIAITVRDTGSGIDRQIRERVFDPFFTTKEKERGTGLGLASAYGIVKNHNGFIEVESGSEDGAGFRICLPASDRTAVEGKEASPSLARGDETILLVDDEEMIIDVGSQMLERLGYTVIPATSGQEAIDRYARLQDRIHLVILDMIMPGLGAGGVFERLQKINSGVRVLLSSGYSINGQAADLLSRGCAAFIQKPFDLNDISHKIRDVLDAG